MEIITSVMGTRSLLDRCTNADPSITCSAMEAEMMGWCLLVQVYYSFVLHECLTCCLCDGVISAHVTFLVALCLGVSFDHCCVCVVVHRFTIWELSLFAALSHHHMCPSLRA